MKIFYVINIISLFLLCFVFRSTEHKHVYFKIPNGWPKPVYDFSKNPITGEGFALGKKLFFDTRLSSDNSIACGTCHYQEYAFADAEKKFSKGVNGKKGKRNTPGLFNLAWNKSFMWDGGVNHIEVQPLAPIANKDEMNETLSNVLIKIAGDKNYRSMFKAAFGTDTITSQRMFWALTQYMGNFISNNSKYDKVQNGKAKFTAEEKSGYAIFQKNCSSCHPEPLFTNYTYRNNGISTSDSGRYKITHNANDLFMFKVPSLRNIELTNPYMHDGQFSTLRDVINHYNTSGYKIFDRPLNLSPGQQVQLEMFLKTLTDYEFINDTKYK